MEDGDILSQNELRNVPTKFKSNVWTYCGFYNEEGKKDIDTDTHTICKDCCVKIKHSGNTTNMRAHLSQYHPAALADEGQKKPVLPKKQPRLDTLSLSKTTSKF